MSGWSVGTANHHEILESLLFLLRLTPWLPTVADEIWKNLVAEGKKFCIKKPSPSCFKMFIHFHTVVWYFTRPHISIKKKFWGLCVHLTGWLVQTRHFFKQPWHKHFVNIDCCHCHFTKLVIKCVLQEDLSFELCALQLSLPQGEPVVITSWTYPQYLHNRAYPLFLSLSLHSLQYFDLCF